MSVTHCTWQREHIFLTESLIYLFTSYVLDFRALLGSVGVLNVLGVAMNLTMLGSPRPFWHCCLPLGGAVRPGTCVSLCGLLRGIFYLVHV